MISTCGIFLISLDNLILIGHPTNGTKWSIPKGELDEGETTLECAIREFKEEANIFLSRHQINDLSNVKYSHGKKTLVPFYFKSLIVASEFSPKCYSMVELPGQEPFPEIDEFKWVTLEEAKELLHETQVEALKELEGIGGVFKTYLSTEPLKIGEGYKDELEIERRWVLKNKPWELINFNKCSNILLIFQYYTKNGRFRKVNISDSHSNYKETKHYHTIKTYVSPGVNREQEKEITCDEFDLATKVYDKSIIKTRYIYYNEQNQKIELDYFMDSNMYIAEVELNSITEEVIFPDFIARNILVEVTGDKKWSNYNLALPYGQ